MSASSIKNLSDPTNHTRFMENCVNTNFELEKYPSHRIGIIAALLRGLVCNS